MERSLLVGLALLALLGCSRPHRVAASGQGSEVLGSPTDMTTQPGSYPGYEVYRSCKIGWPLQGFAIVGTGSTPFPWLAKGFDEHGNFDDALLEQFRGEAQGVARAPIDSTGYGVPCHGKALAFRMTLADWRALDGIAARLGAWMLQHDYQGEIVVQVEPLPVLF